MRLGLIRQAKPVRDAIDIPASQNMGEAIRLAKEKAEGFVSQIEPARIGTESRQNAAIAIAHETAPPHRAAQPADTRHRMKMTGDLAFTRAVLRLMPEANAADGKFRDDIAIKA